MKPNNTYLPILKANRKHLMRAKDNLKEKDFSSQEDYIKALEAEITKIQTNIIK